MTGQAALRTSPVGTTGVTIPAICFGTSALGDMPGTYGYSVDEERALATVRAIFDGPCKFLDTSRTYGLGRSEERIGKVIRERGGLPPGFVVSTKLDRNIETGVFDVAQARRSLEESLTALNLDRVHILHFHDPEYAASLDECRVSIGDMFKMKEEGIADAVGLAAGNVEVMMPLLREWEFDILITHNRFMLTNRNAEPMIDLARERGTAVMNAAPFAGGVLAKGTAKSRRYAYQDATNETMTSVRAIEAICAEHDIPIGAAALQFSMRDGRVASTVCGVSKPERVEQTLTWANWDIPDAVWEALTALPYDTFDPEATRVWDPG